MNKLPVWSKDLILSILISLLLGAVLAPFSTGSFLEGWLAFSVLLLVGSFLCIRTWRFLGAGRSLAILMAVTFAARILTAIIIGDGLPVWGYDNPVNRAGFLYSDAYARNQAAFSLAQENKPLITAFTHPDTSDQYGGLLFLSASVYRFLSPDANRPLLISLLAALAMTLGAAFLVGALQQRWSNKIAFLAGWIYALSPDSFFLGSSQMREPFLIGLLCVGLWALFGWKGNPWRAAVISIVTLTAVAAISTPAAGIYFGILLLIFALEWSLSRTNQTLHIFGLILLIGIFAATVASGWFWLRSTLYYDSYRAMMDSGWIQELIRTYGDKWMIPLTTVYGLIQPLLPAAITDPGALIWRIIAILRALGWISVLPLLFFGLFAAIKARKQESAELLLLFNGIFLVWVVISSARAGGNLWDNPRYRYMLLPLLALLAAWAIDRYQVTRSPWLWRWTAVFGEFTLLMLNLYINRYIKLGTGISFAATIAFSVVLAVLIVLGSVVYDFSRRKSQKVST